VAALGVIVPFVGGYLFCIFIGFGTIESLFVGAAMVATSVGITARVIKDMGVTQAKESRVIIGAAVIDDVLGMIILGIVVGIAGGSGSNLTNTVIIAIEAILFVIGIMFLGNYLGKYVAKKNTQTNICVPKNSNNHTLKISALSIALILCFGLSYLASVLQLAAIVGAFLAGMLFAEFRDKYFCHDQMEAINEFLVPFFFIFVGISVDVSEFGSVIWIAIILTIIAIVTKFLGCGFGAIKMGRSSAMIVGSGMFPRGEVALIVAAIGLSYGVVTSSVFNIVVFMAIATTLASPPMLSYFFKKKYGEGQKMVKKIG
ncbi:MAG TPA: cation:proton antiporter, partial [Methanomassiliicoccales archaeon]|nr:cation:proton antiporter [Methanomassiliicoccales archaeon]